MQKTVIGLVAALLTAGALAQRVPTPLEPQFVGLDMSLRAVQRLINDADDKISVGQAERLLPYLREVRATSALTGEDAAFYTQSIQRVLTPKQLEVTGLKPRPTEAPAGTSADQGMTGGGAGGGSSAAMAAMTVASNPFLEGDLVKSLDDSILHLTRRAERTQ